MWCLALCSGCRRDAEPEPLASKEIGAGGGVIELASGPLAGTKLEVPEGALPSGVTLTVHEGKEIATEMSSPIGTSIELGPSGTRFEKPVRITLPFDVSRLPADAVAEGVRVAVRETDDGPVVLQAPVEVDLVAGRAVVEASHFTTFQTSYGTFSYLLPGYPSSGSNLRGYFGQPLSVYVGFFAPGPADGQCRLEAAWHQLGTSLSSPPATANITGANASTWVTFPAADQLQPGGNRLELFIDVKCGSLMTTTSRNTYSFELGPKPSVTLTLPPTALPDAGFDAVVQLREEDGGRAPPGFQYDHARVEARYPPDGGVLSGGSVFRYFDGGGEVTFRLSANVPGVWQLNAGINGGLNNPYANILITGGAELYFQVQPPGGTSGQAFTPAPVIALTNPGGDVAGQTVTLSLGQSPTGATFTPITAVTDAAGRATFSSLVLSRSGTYTVIASAPGYSNVESRVFGVSPGPASELIVDQVPADTSADQGYFNPIVQLRDAAGNPSYASVPVTVSLTPSVAGALTGTTTMTTSSGFAQFSLQLHRAGTYQLVFSAPGLPDATSPPFTITAGVDRGVAFLQQPTSSVAGAVISPAVTVGVVDQWGNPKPTANLTVQLSTTPMRLLGTTSASTSASGVATFSALRLQQAGTAYVLTARAFGLNDGTSQPFDVTAGAATGLVVLGRPGPSTAGVTMSPFSIVGVDAYGNRAATPATVTAALTGGPMSPGFTGTLVRQAGATPALFDDFVILASGSYTFTFSSPGLTSAIATSVSVSGAAAARLVFAQQPSSVAAGALIAPAPVIHAQDAYGNVAVPPAITLSLSTNPTGATLQGGSTSTPASGGGVVFSALRLDRAGTGYGLTASATGLTPAVSDPFDVTPAAPASLSFVQVPATATAGSPMSAVRVRILDSLGNQTTSTAAVTLALAANPRGDTLDGALSAAAVAGEATFSDLVLHLVASGYTLSASSSGLTGATSSPISVVAGAPAQLAFTTAPQSAAQLLPLPTAAVVEVRDAFGNPTSATVPVDVALATNPPGAQLGGTTSRTSVDGQASFSGLSVSLPGTGFTLTASSPSLTSATSTSFDVQPLTLAFVSAPAAATANVGFGAQLELKDPAGLRAPISANVTLGLGVNPGGGPLGGLTTLAAVNGLATFTGLIISVPGAGYTLTASAAGMTQVSSAAFVVSDSVTQLSFTRPPSGAAPAVQFTVEVSALDAMSNLVPAYTGPITLAVGNDPNGSSVLSGALTVNAVAGKATFPGLAIDLAGAGFTLVAQISGGPSVTSAPFSIGAPAAADGLGQLNPVTGAFDPTASHSGNPWSFDSPRGIALDTVGHRLFVAEAGSRRVLAYQLSTSDDLQNVDRVPDWVLGAAAFDVGSNSGVTARAFNPAGLAVDSAGRRLFVADLNANRVLVFDISTMANDLSATWVLGQTTFTASTGGTTASNLRLSSFSDVAFDSTSNRLFVSDATNNRVVVYSTATISNGQAAVNVLGQASFSANTSGTTATTMFTPQGLGLDTAANRLWVADTSNHRVLGFDLASLGNGMAASLVLGQSSSTTRTTGNGAAQMNWPQDVAAGSGRLFVLERNNARIGVFNLATVSSGAAAANVLGRPTFTMAYPVIAGTSAERLNTSVSSLLWNAGRLWAGDADTVGRVLVYDVASLTDGEAAVDAIGPRNADGTADLTRLAGLDPFAVQPVAVAIDTTRHWLYVADNNVRILGFRLSAAHTFAGEDRWADLVLGRGAFGPATPTIASAQALAIDEPRNLLFVGTATGVLVYSLTGISSGAAPTNTLGTSPSGGVTATSLGNVGALAYDAPRQLLFVADGSGERVVVYDVATVNDFEPAIAVIGRPSLTDSSLQSITATTVNQVAGLAYDAPTKRLFVAQGFRVLAFDVTTIVNEPTAIRVLGQTSFTTNGVGTSQTQLRTAAHLTIDPLARVLYVADTFNHRVLSWPLDVTSDGAAALSYWGQSSWTSFTPDVDLMAAQRRATASGLTEPRGVAFDPVSRWLWIADYQAIRLVAHPVP